MVDFDLRRTPRVLRPLGIRVNDDFDAKALCSHASGGTQDGNMCLDALLDVVFVLLRQVKYRLFMFLINIEGNWNKNHRTEIRCKCRAIKDSHLPSRCFVRTVVRKEAAAAAGEMYVYQTREGRASAGGVAATATRACTRPRRQVTSPQQRNFARGHVSEHTDRQDAALSRGLTDLRGAAGAPGAVAGAV